MKKIPTIFVRDMSKQPALVTPEWKDGCEWVRDGEGRATIKLDGTCCMVRDGKLYKRRELKPSQVAPAGFETADFDEETGKTVGWVECGLGPDDQYHREGFDNVRARDGSVPDGTYELIGPKIQGNHDELDRHILAPHGEIGLSCAPRTFDELKAWLSENHIEGIVWHHPDGRMAKVKRRDFGLRW
jgi:hypothetical protein